MDYLQDLETKLQSALNNSDVETAINVLKEINAKGIDLSIEYELRPAQTKASVAYSSQKQFSECSDSGPVLQISQPSPNTKSANVKNQPLSLRFSQSEEHESEKSISIRQKRFEAEDIASPTKRDEATSRVARDTGRQTGREEEEKVGFVDPSELLKDYTDGSSRVVTDRSLIPVQSLTNLIQPIQQSDDPCDEDDYQEEGESN